MNNLMPKIAEMLGVKMNDFVTIESLNNSSKTHTVKITDSGLKLDSPPHISGGLPIIVLNVEDDLLNDWLCGNYRVKGSFPKDGDRAYAFSNGDLICGNRLPHIEAFVFDSKSQFHLLLREKGLVHETVEEAVKYFEKDYNIYKEMQNVNGVVE